ncbi:MAG TPA: hypothetical protein PKY82_00905 [Pyrinomonadaceae bacterium]|nr:hypothetical protein [Pyrinomonadaceae bacterium]
MKKLLLISLFSLFLMACGGAGAGSSSPKLNIKVGGKDSTMEVKSGGVYYGNVISTSPGKPPIQTFSHSIYLANYEMDTTNATTMKKALTSLEQVRILIGLQGEEGTKDDSPFRVGTYTLKAERFNKVSTVMITTFADGNEKSDNFDTMSSMSKADGEVKITSVTADSVSGEINVTEGDKTIKGTFTAKLPKK